LFLNIQEAGEKGGTINIAKWAIKQKKSLFIIPSDTTSGSKKLLSMGAIPVTNPGELVNILQS
jgi:predicted Rossmann fold nucleotide-binding protein DprA/Smf involved in DNA uptake